jgi:hypothetical protein
MPKRTKSLYEKFNEVGAMLFGIIVGIGAAILAVVVVVCVILQALTLVSVLLGVVAFTLELGYITTPPGLLGYAIPSYNVAPWLGIAAIVCASLALTRIRLKVKLGRGKDKEEFKFVRDSHQKGTVVATRLIGMTLGIACLSIWGLCLATHP